MSCLLSPAQLDDVHALGGGLAGLGVDVGGVSNFLLACRYFLRGVPGEVAAVSICFFFGLVSGLALVLAMGLLAALGSVVYVWKWSSSYWRFAGQSHGLILFLTSFYVVQFSPNVGKLSG